MKRLKGFLKWTALIVIVSIICIISFVLYKEISYIPVPIEINQQINLYTPLLDHYYVDLSSRKYLNMKYIFDRSGIPIFRINGKDHYHPGSISQFALGAFEYYLNTGDINARNAFLRCADWLKDNLRKHGSFFYWEYTFDWGFAEGLHAPWVSAIAQGQGASVLLRAFSVTKDEKYLKAAKKAIRPIFYDVSEGGISVVKGNDYIFPQEYPTNPHSDLLDGAIAAYFGVYDYYRVTADSDVRQFHDIILKTLLSVIDQYDTGYWSLYSLWPRYLANPHYNAASVTLLRELYLITGNRKFLIYSERFRDYQSSWVNRTKYVFANHLRQAKDFSFEDIKKIPEFLKMTLTFRNSNYAVDVLAP